MKTCVDYFDTLAFVLKQVETGMDGLQKFHLMWRFAFSTDFENANCRQPLFAASVQRALNRLDQVFDVTGIRDPILEFLDDGSWVHDMTKTLKMFDMIFSEDFFKYIPCLYHLLGMTEKTDLIEQVMQKLATAKTLTDDEKELKRWWDRIWEFHQSSGICLSRFCLHAFCPSTWWKNESRYYKNTCQALKKYIRQMHTRGDMWEKDRTLENGGVWLNNILNCFTRIERRVYSILPILRIMRMNGHRPLQMSCYVEKVPFVRCVFWMGKNILEMGIQITTERRTAVAMAMHNRLGADCSLRAIPVDVMKKFVDDDGFVVPLHENDQVVQMILEIIQKSVAKKGFRAICGTIPKGLYAVL